MGGPWALAAWARLSTTTTAKTAPCVFFLTVLILPCLKPISILQKPPITNRPNPTGPISRHAANRPRLPEHPRESNHHPQFQQLAEFQRLDSRVAQATPASTERAQPCPGRRRKF